MQHNVVDFATKLLVIKAQIICQHFTDETILKISGSSQLSQQDQQLVPQALELLRNEASANFRIEVTSDSMIFQDEEAEKQNRMAFLQAVGGFMQQALPMAAQSPEMAPMLMEMLKFSVTAFRAGKQLEGIIDETADKLRESAQKMEGQPKPPPPEVQKLQMQAQTQMEVQKFQAQNELEKAKQEYQAQENQLKFKLEEERNTKEAEMTNNRDILLAYLDNATKIETARINQGLDDGSEAYIRNIETAKLLQDTMGYDMTQHPLEPVVQNLQQQNQQLAQMIAAIHEKLNQPKTVIRDENGRIMGVR
jgi:hypothetical protein